MPQQFDLLKASAITLIQSDLEGAVEADRILAQTAAATATTQAGIAGGHASDAAGSAAEANTSATQAELAAIAAGAPIVTALTSPVPANGTIELLKLDAGLQVHEVVAGAWVLRGWLVGPKFEPYTALFADTSSTFGPDGTVVEYGPHRAVVDSTLSASQVPHAGGVRLRAIDAQSALASGAPAGGTITSGATFVGSTATAGPDARSNLQALIDRSETDKLPYVDLSAGVKNFTLTSGPLHLVAGGALVRGDRGMTYSRGLGKNGAIILGAAVPYAFHVGEGVTPAAPGASGADCYTFENLGFMKDTAAALKSQSGIYWDLQSNGPPRGVNIYGVSASGLRAGFELAPPVFGCSTSLANLTFDGVGFSNNRYGLFASAPLYGLRVVGSQIEQNNAFGAPATGLTGVTIAAVGAGYTNGRRVWLTGADGGRAASGTIAVTAGGITGVTIDVQGFGYTVGEVLSVVTGQGTGATATVATIAAPDQWEGGAIHGNIQGPITIVDNQIEGQPNPIDLQALGGPAGVGGSANIAARISHNYIETVNVNSSKFVARLGTTERFHVNSLDFGPNFYAGSALPPDFLIINKRGNWRIDMKDRSALTFERWNGSILRDSNIFGPGIDHFFIKGFSADPNSAPEIFLGDGFSRRDPSGSAWTHTAAFDTGELVKTGRGEMFVRDAVATSTPLGFAVTAGDLVVITAYVSVQNRNALIFRGQVTRNAGNFIASLNDSYADIISRGDWVHICYAFLAPSSVPDIAFKFGTSGGANTVNALIAGLCARNYGAYTNDGVARQQIIPVAPRLL